MFRYLDLGWDSVYYVRRSMIGYRFPTLGGETTYQHPFSNRANAYRLHQLTGNTASDVPGGPSVKSINSESWYVVAGFFNGIVFLT